MTLPCDSGLMGKFSWPFFLPVTQEVSETICCRKISMYTVSVDVQGYGKRAKNGEIVMPLFCVKHEYFTGNKGCLQQCSTVESNFIGLCFRLLSTLIIQRKTRAPYSVFIQSQPLCSFLDQSGAKSKPTVN